MFMSSYVKALSLPNSHRLIVNLVIKNFNVEFHV